MFFRILSLAYTTAKMAEYLFAFQDIPYFFSQKLTYIFLAPLSPHLADMSAKNVMFLIMANPQPSPFPQLSFVLQTNFIGFSTYCHVYDPFTFSYTLFGLLTIIACNKEGF